MAKRIRYISQWLIRPTTSKARGISGPALGAGWVARQVRRRATSSQIVMPIDLCRANIRPAWGLADGRLSMTQATATCASTRGGVSQCMSWAAPV